VWSETSGQYLSDVVGSRGDIGIEMGVEPSDDLA
jgi:hypothetical protein